jgi:murein tripeptide amidase MpaA
MDIDADYDSGKILVVSGEDPEAVELALLPDNAADFMHWWSFRVRGEAGRPHRLRIGNAGESSYPLGFQGLYRAVASYDREDWFRVPTTYADGALTIEHTPEADEIDYACFAPYPFARAEALVERAAASDLARIERLGETVDGRPLDVVVIGAEGRGALRAWILGRQHPGEPHGSWFVEAAIDRLLDEDDAVARQLRDRFVFYCVPMMNPDGVARGNHRTNAAGLDLNRQWMKPDHAACPEVFLVRRALLEGGADFFLDAHGDEDIPYVFAAGAEGNPHYTARIDALEDLFQTRLLEIDPDFQREHGYDHDTPGRPNLKAASNWVGQRFDCLSLTLEMPFIDNANRPDPARGWSPERCASFARSTLAGLLACANDLR